MKHWVKKLGPRHYMGRHQTVCGIAMLGNNYDKERPDAPMCENCLRIMKERQEGTWQSANSADSTLLD